MVMGASTRRRVDSAVRRIFSFLATDTLTCVLSTEVQKELPALIQNTTSVTEALVVDQAGSRFGVYVEATVSLIDLQSNGVTVENILYFLIDGERYDFTITDGYRHKIVPLGGLHNLILFYLNRASERESTEEVTTIGFEDE
jgi:uncharacterized protein (DUF1919 family)